MSARTRRRLLFLFVASICFASTTGVLFGPATAQTATAPVLSPPLGETQLAERKTEARPSSRVDYFRQLLDMPPNERESELAQITPESKRKSLEAKIAEYIKMTAEERQARLRVVEIWDHLQRLMRLAPTERADRLAAVPAAHRPFIEERLKQWDQVSPERRKEVLDNELAIFYFLRLESSTPAQREVILNNLPEDSRRALEEQLAQWRSLTQERRQRVSDDFQRFFEMPTDEREKTLHVVSPEERQRLEKSLRAFENLLPHQRETCLESFQKFANMSKEERDQFLKNIERWQEMSPRDRQSWINLINLFPAQMGPPIPGVEPPRQPPGPASAPGGVTKPAPLLPGAQAKPRG